MFVFWWQGKGFITALIVAVSVILVGMTADAIHAPSYTSGFWASAFAIAALANWAIGRRINERRRKSFGLLSPLQQLTYRARHKFMSLPMESWSVAMLALAIFNGVSALVRR